RARATVDPAPASSHGTCTFTCASEAKKIGAQCSSPNTIPAPPSSVVSGEPGDRRVNAAKSRPNTETIDPGAMGPAPNPAAVTTPPVPIAGESEPAFSTGNSTRAGSASGKAGWETATSTKPSEATSAAETSTASTRLLTTRLGRTRLFQRAS